MPNLRILNKKIFEKINNKLSPTLHNLDYAYKPFIIAFSGVPGSGKSGIAKKLEQKYNAVRINNDFIRDIIKKEKLTKSKEDTQKLSQEYNFYLITNLPFKNKRIILEKSLDRNYKWFLNVCKFNGLKYFIIRINVPGIKIALQLLGKRERIKDREKNSMKRWFREYKSCIKHLKADVTLNTLNPDLNKLYKRLDRALI